MADEIRLVYATAEEMIHTFKSGKDQLEKTEHEMQALASQLEGGALLGQGGENFKEAIRGKLCPAINRLSDKFEELMGDVQKAIEYMQQADQKSKSKF